ncbi:hypothetical protein K402DRAFT_326791 [Aulographum hederae CBS 113979]|uniref:Ubiquitin-activating enzyme E1-like n=1 Tax=Aulographum hederae CBS 113979 TaxID=1176131 RepID=A0A6G1H824_9PEZI|nr:hypothetical protein K402DRAFT_326791 [Aulographum hederae CBS 113979]
MVITGHDRFLRQSLGVLHSRIKQARVLMVGAGGIGCELLKNLVLTGFGEIHVVDLDTIDLSNLNRQFLFRHEHIKKSKALVAKESAGKFNPNAKIEAYHANIKDPQFNIDWYQSFAVVFNALDNIDARRHVNKMCITADVPLIESGTTGFNGQVQVIKRGRSECYDCNTKETPKSFPVCTIRSTPSQPIHCIVWAKSYLFTEIFGTSEDDAPELDHSEDSENADEIRKLREESQALKRIRESMGSVDFPRLVFQKVFTEDIDRLRSMEDMWMTRKAPESLDFEAVSRDALGVGSAVAQQDQNVWTLAENYAVFADSLKRLSERMETLKANVANGDAPPILTFDKDDTDTLDFVAASANLRSIIFDIETRSKFDIKQMAGNIIPAIATTNAMTAGLCVLQAFKVLRDDLQKARMIFLTTSTERVINAEPLQPPNKDCPVCSVAQAKLGIDMKRATLGDLVDKVLKPKLGYGEEFSISSDAGIIYDPELDDNLCKKFSEMGIAADSFLTVVDEEDDGRVDLRLAIYEQSFPEDADPFMIQEDIEIPNKPKKVLPAPPSVANGDAVGPMNGIKRKRGTDEVDLEELRLAKKSKVPEMPTSKDQPIVLDDVDSGAIMIDDD